MDWGALGYLGVVAVILVIRRDRLPSWPAYTAAHLALAFLVVSIVAVHRRWESRPVRFLRLWYPVFLIPAIFKLNVAVVPAVNPADLDLELLAWDRAIFGEHPAAYLKWLESLWMTDILRLCWMSYFVLPFVVVIPIYRRCLRPGRDFGAFVFTVFALTAGWYLSYLGYFVTPAIGPGYYPDLVGAPPARVAATTDSMLQTLWVLEGDRVRDICPSGHVIIAVLTLWIAFRFRLRVRWWLAPIVAGLVVGTVYLRFHYGVDVLAGLAIVVVVAIASLVVHRTPGEAVDAS